MNSERAHQIAASTDLSTVPEETLVDAVAVLIRERAEVSREASAHDSLDRILSELLLQHNWSPADLRELGIQELDLRDALVYYGLGPAPDDIQEFTEQASQLGLLTTDGHHISTRDLWLVEQAIDITAEARGLTSGSS